MTNPRDDLMALADRLRELVFRQGQIDWDALIKIEIDLRLAASRPTTQVVDREAVAHELGYRFATLVSGNNQPHMSGDPRARLLPHIRRRFDEACDETADAVLSLLRPAEPVEAEGVGEPKPAGWQRSLRYANAPVWEQCSTSEATSQFDRSPYYDYRPLYTHPPAQPDTSAAVLAERERCAALAETTADELMNLWASQPLSLRRANQSDGPKAAALRALAAVIREAELRPATKITDSSVCMDGMACGIRCTKTPCELDGVAGKVTTSI